MDAVGAGGSGTGSAFGRGKVAVACVCSWGKEGGCPRGRVYVSACVYAGVKSGLLPSQADTRHHEL